MAHSQRTRASQANHSSRHSQRPGTSSQFVVEDHEELAASQISPNKSLSSQEHVNHVANVVKYILAAASLSRVPIAKTAISKAINCHNRNFKSVLDNAVNILRDTFGYDVLESDGKLIVYNRIKNELPHLEFNEDETHVYSLLFVILAHIHMSGGHADQASLMKFLVDLGLINDASMKSELFGDVLVLMREFVKEKYLHTEKAKNAEGDDEEFSWGIRAEKEISLRTIMEFVSKVYHGRGIDTWRQQYEAMLLSEGRQPGRSRRAPSAARNGSRVEHMEE